VAAKARAIAKRPRRPSVPVLVGGIALLGFLFGFVLLVVVPAGRAGSGPLASFLRARPRVTDVRFRPLPEPTSTAVGARPELWQTPLGVQSFPSADRSAALARQPGAIVATYTSGQSVRVIAPPALKDAVGRPVVAVVVTFGTDEVFGTPAPLRPQIVEPTQVTLTGLGADGRTGSCVLGFRGDIVQAVGAMGSAALDGCANGQLRAPSGDVVGFAVDYDRLPNHRTRDGVWLPGAVFGRTVVTAALNAAAA
jgi:hypothetical protein